MSFYERSFVDQAECKAALRRLLQAGSRLYMQFARETIARFGVAGEGTVRQHLRQYGVWRGTEMREAHNALGLPLDMETLNRCWDSASVFIVKSDLESKGKYSAYDVQYEVHDCPAADVWRAEDFHHWGHVYCDEFHQACASTYHPDGNVVIPINMMKGDDHCSFRWIIPAGSPGLANFPPSPLGQKLAQYYVAETPARAVYDAMARTSRLIGGRYWTMARALADRHDAA
ncbi:MAG TPA: L-2-amino-thiazoline-4-carboxylic acid hydrolase, partial [Thermomicrobiales bacterium]|nr:L-2-amino-thiazoline-4-carboxylic acid hydrolase [Thermomicrobiales bacterium]